MLESVVHFLLDVEAVFLKLASGPCLEIIDPVILTLDLGCNTVIKFGLALQTLFLLYGKSLLNFLRLFSQSFKDFTFLLYSCISFSFNA